MTATPVLPELARFVLGPLDTSGEVLHAGRRTLLNAAALAVGSARHQAVEAACRVVYRLTRKPEASILGRQRRVEAEWAGLAGGIAVHAEDYDDTHLATVVHPAAPVVPAALAMAEWCGSGGRDLLEAVVMGVETACRVGLGFGPGHFDRGWHLTGSTGRYGAAAAAARLAGLDAAALTGVWARCAAETAGVQAAFGTMVKPYHPGKAAYDGIAAVRNAIDGRRFAFDPLTAEEEIRFAVRLGPDTNLSRITADLGSRWEILNNAFKPYACGVVSHPVIDGAAAVRQEIIRADAGGMGPIDLAGAVARVTVTVNPVVLEVMGVQEPRTGLESKFSVYHCAAVGILDGGGGPPQFSDRRVLAPDVGGLRRKVEVITDAALARDASRLEVETVDGRRFGADIDHARGSAARPMTDADLIRKAGASMRPVIAAAADKVIEMVFSIESYEARDLVRITCGGPMS